MNTTLAHRYFSEMRHEAGRWMRFKSDGHNVAGVAYAEGYARGLRFRLAEQESEIMDALKKRRDLLADTNR